MFRGYWNCWIRGFLCGRTNVFNVGQYVLKWDFLIRRRPLIIIKADFII